MRELVERYKQKKISFNKQHETLDKENENNNFYFQTFGIQYYIFVMDLISVIIMFIVIKLIFKGEKM